MPVVQASVTVDVPIEVAFAVSQTTGEVRRRWDTFIAEQHFLDGATAPGKGVRTFTRQRFGFAMVTLTILGWRWLLDRRASADRETSVR